MTDDRFLNALKEPPRPEFERDLGARLRRLAREQDAAATPPRPTRAPRWVAAFAALAVVSALLLSPGVRASAQAFLDLFRVQNFVAVSFDRARMEKLASANLDLESVVANRVETVLDPGPRRGFASAAAAGSAAGFAVRVPTLLPARLTADSAWVDGEGRRRVVADATRLRQAMELLEVRDLAVPTGLDGATIEVHTYPAVRQRFRRASLHAFVLQSRSPEVSLPADVGLPQLGEIALRLAGLEAGDARRMAERIDWRGTMLVPVPADVGSFREVTIQGHRALLVTRSARTDAKGEKRSPGATVLWSDGTYVFAAGGNLGADDVLAMAESVR